MPKCSDICGIPIWNESHWKHSNIMQISNTKCSDVMKRYHVEFQYALRVTGRILTLQWDDAGFKLTVTTTVSLHAAHILFCTLQYCDSLSLLHHTGSFNTAPLHFCQQEEVKSLTYTLNTGSLKWRQSVCNLTFCFNTCIDFKCRRSIHSNATLQNISKMDYHFSGSVKKVLREIQVFWW